jgi:DtxR family transcriptional regulator, manganese transport regulator
MPTKKPIADRHRRTRDDHASETAEDYVEAVADLSSGDQECRVADLAKRFDVSHVTVTKIVARLVREGLLETERYAPVQLTTAGKRLAAKCKERHETVFAFLVALGVPPEVAAVDAEGIEHHVSPQTLARFAEFAKKLAAS